MSEAERFTLERTQQRLQKQREREERRKQLLEEAVQAGLKRVSNADPEPIKSPQKKATTGKPAARKSIPEGFGAVASQLKTRAGPVVDTDDDPDRRAPGPTLDSRLSNDSVLPAAPLTKQASVAAERIKEDLVSRASMVQKEIEELQDEVTALRQSRASRRISTAGTGDRAYLSKGASTTGSFSQRAPDSKAGATGGAPPSPRRLPMGATPPSQQTMDIGLPTNVRKMAGVTFGEGGGLNFDGEVPEELRQALGIVKISGPADAKKGGGITLRDGKFEVGGDVPPEIRQMLEAMKQKKSAPSR